jgi:hypothetical protein|nr:MAG TPA: DnaK suppressor protein [Caudoviricetes sp.]
MVDIIDTATDDIILAQEACLRGIRRKAAAPASIKPVSSQKCIICGTSIPVERQQAIPGCCLCVDCQEEKEKRSNAI